MRLSRGKIKIESSVKQSFLSCEFKTKIQSMFLNILQFLSFYFCILYLDPVIRFFYNIRTCPI